MYCPACGKPLQVQENAPSRTLGKEFICANRHCWEFLLDDIEGDHSSYQPLLSALEWDEAFWREFVPNATIVEFNTGLK